ncbi:DUF397 domain-containing protein [Streptomyces sp. NPDC056738]|uniref:DUF397 domain-containing protein n=1 Tax=Streptomyces sp. NPDC056738 TaxID=3345933 RepID=UPI003679ADB1
MSEKPNWRTSSYTSQDSCVEIADNTPQTVLVRDTKNRNYGVVAVASEAWTDFVQDIKHRPST